MPHKFIQTKQRALLLPESPSDQPVSVCVCWKSLETKSTLSASSMIRGDWERDWESAAASAATCNGSGASWNQMLTCGALTGSTRAALPCLRFDAKHLKLFRVIVMPELVPALC